MEREREIEREREVNRKSRQDGAIDSGRGTVDRV